MHQKIKNAHFCKVRAIKYFNTSLLKRFLAHCVTLGNCKFYNMEARPLFKIYDNSNHFNKHNSYQKIA